MSSEGKERHMMFGNERKKNIRDTQDTLKDMVKKREEEKAS